MGKVTKARASEELWHLGIGDLLVPSVKAAPAVAAVVDGPFVLNLRTSSTPIGGISNALRRFKHLHVYQLERHHEGHRQFLLRLGIIETDLEADAILATLREEYPGAFKASAGDEDRKAVVAPPRITTARPTAQKAVAKRPEAPPHPPKPPAPVAAAAADPQPPFRWNIDEVLPELGAQRTSKARRQPQTRAVPQPRRATPPAARAAIPATRAATPPAPTARSVAHSAQPRSPTMVSVPAPADSPRPAGSSASSIAAAPQVSAAKAAPRWTDEEMACDPNAVTDQVEAPGFALATPTYEAEAPQPPEIKASAAQAPDIEAATRDRPHFEPASIGPAAIGIDAVELTAADAPTAIEPERADTALPASTATETAAPALVSAEVADPASARAGVTPEPPTESAPTETPQIDSTQTIRALTSLELEDGQSSRWFAIQLLMCEKEIDPHEVPNLSIFAEYRLYAVTGLDKDRCMHALRLGFFSSENAAAAVAGYLGTFFDAPCIKRVSIAEHDRFEEGRVTARKDVGAGDGHVVIELAGPAPSTAPRASEKLPAQAKHDTPKATSIWSRLLPTRRS